MNNNNSIFKCFVQREFCKEYKVVISDIKKNSSCFFQYLCFLFLSFMRYIPLPKEIPSFCAQEAILFEFRCLPHVEFLVRNTMYKLGNAWAYTIVCCPENYLFIQKMCKEISSNIRIISIHISSSSCLSVYFTSVPFWKMFFGETLLLYEENSLLFHSSIDSFFVHDYIGNCEQDSFFCLCKKQFMIESLLPSLPQKKQEQEEEKITNGMEIDMSAFVSTSAVYNANSLGGHFFWAAFPDTEDHLWKKEMKNKFNYRRYLPKSDLLDFLQFHNVPFCKRLFVNHYSLEKINNIASILSCTNFFDIDLYFFCKVNNISLEENETTISSFLLPKLKENEIGGLYGKIYHPKQLTNFFGKKKEIFRFLNDLFIFHELKIYRLNDFVSTFIYNASYADFCSSLLTCKYSSFSFSSSSSSLLVLVFIGNEMIGHDLLEKIKVFESKFYAEPSFHLAVCFSPLISYRTSPLKKKIIQAFPFARIYTCKELGTDIGPTLLMYDDICQKNNQNQNQKKEYVFTHVLKFHTKSISQDYLNLTDYLLNQSVEDLLAMPHAFYPSLSNCIGHPNYYFQILVDSFNNDLKNMYLDQLHTDFYFIGGTIFYTSSAVFDSMVAFLKTNHFQWYLLNSMYENNMIQRDCSPTHFLERLFGVLKQEKHNNNINNNHHHHHHQEEEIFIQRIRRKIIR